MKTNIPWRIVGQFDNPTIEDAKENRIALVACYDTAVPNYERSQERAALIVSAVNSHEAAQRLAEAATAVMIDSAHMQHNDAYVISAEVYNRLIAARAEWEAVK